MAERVSPTAQLFEELGRAQPGVPPVMTLEELIKLGQKAAPALAPPPAPAPTPTPAPTGFPSLEELIRLGGSDAPVVPATAPAVTRPPQVVAGLQRGLLNLQVGGLAVTGAFVGALGFDEERDSLFRAVLEKAQDAPPPPSTFQESFGSIGDFARFTAFTLGEQAPIIASIIAGGGLGSVAGRLAGRALAPGIAASIMQRFGGLAGVITTASGIETGATLTEQLEATGKANTPVAVAAGFAKGALEAIVPLAFARRFGLLGGQADDFLGRIIGQLDSVANRPTRAAIGASSASIIEGATEFLQEVIDVVARDFVDANFDVLGEGVGDRLINAAGTGALLGFFLGGAGGAIAPKGTPQVPATEEELRARVGGTDLGDTGLEDLDPSEGEELVEEEKPAVEEPTEQIAVLQAKGGVLQEFLPPTEALIASARAEGEGQSFRLARLRKDALEGLDTTATLSRLPSKLTRRTEGVSFTRPETAKEALKAAKTAVVLRNKVVQTKTLGSRLPTLEAAERDFAEATRLGFRFKPREDEGFVVVGALPEEALVPIEATEARLPVEGVVQEGAAVLLLGGRTAFPLSVLAAANLGMHIAPRPGRSFAVDVSRLPPDSITSSDLVRRLDAKGLPGPQGKLIELETIGPFSPAQLVDAVERSSVFRFAEGTSEEDKSRTAKLIQRGTGLNVLANRELHSLGLRATPVSVSDTVVISEDIATSTAKVLSTFPKEALTEVPSAPSAAERVAGIRPHFSEAELDSALAAAPDEGRGLRTLKGASYLRAEHELGAAVAVIADGQQLSRGDRRRLNRIEKFYTGLMRKLGMSETRLVVYMDSILTGSTLMGAELDVVGGGMFSAVDSSDGFIGILTGVEPRFHDETVTHEFGHFIAFHELTNAEPGVRAKLVEAYNRALIRAALGDVPDFRRAFFPPAKFAAPILDFANSVPAVEAMLKNAFGGPNYWLSFDEWFADQVSRWVSQGVREPIDSVERFMRNVARKLRLLFKSAFRLKGLAPKDFNASAEVVAYLEALAQRRVEGQPSITRAAVSINVARAQEAAAKKKGPFNSPPNGEMVGPRQMLGKLGLSSADKTRADEILDATTHFNRFRKVMWTIFQVANKNPSISWLQNYVHIVDRWRNAKANWLAPADKRIRDWRRLGKDQADKLSLFLFDLDAMTFLTRKEDEANVLRQPTEAELVQLARKHGLSAAGFDLHVAIRDDFTNVLNNMERISIADVERSLEDVVAKEIEKARIAAEFKALRARPYFPHSRFGDFIIVVKDKDKKTAHSEQFVTRGEARKARGRIQREFPELKGFKVSGVDKLPQSVQVFRGLPPSLLKRMRGKLLLSEEQSRWLDDLIVEFAPSRSFRKRLQHRKNVPGFSMDGMRSYANYFWHASNFMARIEFGDELSRIISEGQAETTELSRQSFDVVKRRRLLEFVEEHRSYIMNPTGDWAQLRSAAFQWWLGFSPASAVLNLTQIPMVALPYLSARFGDIKAAAALVRASRDLRQTYMAPEKQLSRITDADLKQIEVALRQNFLEESIATEIAGVAEGGNLKRMLPGNTAQRWFTDLARLSAAMFQTSEKMNRRVVFRAGIDLARANPEAKYLAELKETKALDFAQLMQEEGMNEGEAVAFLAGKDAVRETQFNYDSAARPVFMRGKKGTIFTFFMFVQHMWWFTLNSPGNTRFLVMMLMMGGLMGLPGAEDLSAIAKTMARNLLGKDFDVGREVREFVINLTGEDPAVPPELFLHGASRVGFGLPAAFDLIGMPFPSFDFSPNIGLGQLVPGVTELGPPGLDFNQRFARVSEGIAGATFGVGINMMRFFTDDALPWSDSKRWERAMPRALRNVFKATRFYLEGRERTRTGATVVEFDPTDTEDLLEIVAQGLGFTPTRLSRAWDRTMALREVERFWQTRRALLMAQFDHAIEVRDAEATSDMLAAIRRFNTSLPFRSLGITPSNLAASRKARALARRRFEAGLATSRRFQPLTSEVSRLFPEGTESEPAPSGR